MAIYQPTLYITYKNYTTYLKSFHEGSSTRLCNGAKIVDEICLGHPNPSVLDGNSIVILVGDNGDLQLLLGIQHRGVC